MLANAKMATQKKVKTFFNIIRQRCVLNQYDETDPRNYFPKPDHKLIEPEHNQAEDFLKNGDFIGGHLMPWSSNNTFLVWISTGIDNTCISAIYKPKSGEKPLFDFPNQDLYKREYTAYLLSKELGWPNIPTTIIREGPHGIGSVQLYIDADPRITYFDLRADDSLKNEFKKMSIFDVIANNADRKAGHCIQSKNNIIWSIDHGITFHNSFKLRTVMLEYFNQDIESDLLQSLKKLSYKSNPSGDFIKKLQEQISKQEINAMVERLDFLIEHKKLPFLDPNRNLPWPLI